MNFLGIDVGTGGSRAVVIDEAGAIRATKTIEHAAFDSPQTAWAEQDPADWQRAAREAVRAVVAEIGANEIKAVGLSGQMHGSVLLDENDLPVRPALLWCDNRTTEECREITEKIGAQRLIELVANPALTGFTLPKLLWTRRHEPEKWARVRRVLLPKDFVRLDLTGDYATDAADASGTLLLDVKNRRWSGEMLAAFDLDAALLPTVYESPEITGKISKRAAETTGLIAGTPVVAGAGDQAAGAVGLGIVAAGAVSATIGTSGVVFAATGEPLFDPRGRVHTFCHAIPNCWHVMGVTLGAGLSLRWFRDNFGNGADYDELTAAAEKIEPGANGVLYAPYLMGERAPHLDPTARAAFVGLNAAHTAAHLARAVLEGVAFSLKDIFGIFGEIGVPIQKIKLGGGAAKSRLWRQIQTDVYAQTTEIAKAEEGAAYGAAILAGVGAGCWNSVEEACAACVETAETIEPNADAVEILRGQYARYRKLYPALREVFQID